MPQEYNDNHYVKVNTTSRSELRLTLVKLYFRYTERMDDSAVEDVIEDVEKLEAFILEKEEE